MPRASSDARCAGSRSAAKASLPTTMAATSPSTPSLGVDGDGRFQALKVDFTVNVGCYLSGRSLFLLNNIGGIAGVYRIPSIEAGDHRRLHQHDDQRALSRRRPARGDLRHRAADRHRRARSRARSLRAAPAQPGAAVGHALRHRVPLQVRLRRVRGQHAGRSQARRPGGLRGPQGGVRRDGACCAGSAWRTRSRSQPVRSPSRGRISPSSRSIPTARRRSMRGRCPPDRASRRR